MAIGSGINSMHLPSFGYSYIVYMTYDIYMVPLGVGCRAVWVASFLEEFFMRFTALQVVMLGRCGTGTDHQRSQNTLCMVKIRWALGGYKIRF